MDHKGTNTLYSDKLRVTRRTINTPHLSKKNVPKNIWDRYSSISTHNFIKEIDDTRLKKLFFEMRKVMEDSYLSQGATISTYYNIIFSFKYPQ